MNRFIFLLAMDLLVWMVNGGLVDLILSGESAQDTKRAITCLVSIGAVKAYEFAVEFAGRKVQLMGEHLSFDWFPVVLLTIVTASF